MNSDRHHGPYGRFAAMVLSSTLVMFGLTYLTSYEAGHVFFSQTRAWMAVVMGAAMALVMLGFMLHMLKNRAINLVIVVCSCVAFGGALWLVRSQATVTR